jgi:hypothetical protein
MMKLILTVVGALIISTSAWAQQADPSPPTVTLTQAELQALLTSENAKAVANYAAQQAKETYERIQQAFNPKPPPITKEPATPPTPPPRPTENKP